MKIGFFDSGIGGLSVLHHARKMLPGEQFLYYADRRHVPYGEKTRTEILDYVEEAMEFLCHRDVKAVVIACNTATSVAVSTLRKQYKIPIIGMEPAIKKAVEEGNGKRILAAATPITVAGDKMKQLIETVDPHHIVDLVPMPKLVRFAESGIFDAPEIAAYLREELERFPLKDYSALVLGCTHFNFFKDSFRKVLPNTVHFVDGNAGTVAQLIRKLRERNSLESLPSSVEFYDSGEPADKSFMAGLMERLEAMYKL